MRTSFRSSPLTSYTSSSICLPGKILNTLPSVLEALAFLTVLAAIDDFYWEVGSVVFSFTGLLSICCWALVYSRYPFGTGLLFFNLGQQHRWAVLFNTLSATWDKFVTSFLKKRGKETHLKSQMQYADHFKKFWESESNHV